MMIDRYRIYSYDMRLHTMLLLVVAVIRTNACDDVVLGAGHYGNLISSSGQVR